MHEHIGITSKRIRQNVHGTQIWICDFCIHLIHLHYYIHLTQSSPHQNTYATPPVT